MRTKSVVALVCLLLASVAAGAGCGREAEVPAPVSRFAQAIEDCDRPAGWPATQEEIRDAFSDDTFLIRQCAQNRLTERICTAPTEELRGWLQELSMDPDAEVRSRASHALGLFSDPPDAHISEIEVGFPGFPPSEILLRARGHRAVRCEVRLSDVLGGAPAEPFVVHTMFPDAVDGCGRGDMLYEYRLQCPGSVHMQLDCFGSDPRTDSDSRIATCTSPTPSPTATPTSSGTPGSTPSPTPTPSATPTPTPSGTPMPSPSDSPSPSPTP